MIPDKLTIGDSLLFKVHPYKNSDGRLLSPPDWSLSLSIRSAVTSYNLTADDNWNFSIPATASGLVAGLSTVQIYASKDPERITIHSGQIRLIANLSAQEGVFDARTQTRKDLDAVKALISQLISTGGVVEYRIGNRLAKKYDLPELLALESRLKSQVVREEKADRIANGQGNPHKVAVRFR